MATISKTVTKSGEIKYKVMYDVNTEIGNRKRLSRTFAAGTPYKDVLAFKTRAENEYRAGKLQFDSLKEEQVKRSITLSDFVENVYFESCTKYLSPTTIEGYKRLYTNRKPHGVKNYFGNRKMNSIKRKEIQEYINMLADTVSPKSCKEYKAWLHNVFSEAIRLEMISITDNPATRIKMPPKKRTEIEAFTVEEIEKLLKLNAGNTVSRTIIGLGALAGLRRGEMAGLKWSCVDLSEDNPTISIVETRVTAEGKETIKAPKTTAGKRVIPIPKPLLKILKDAKYEYSVNKLKMGREFADSDYVIFKPDGTPYSPDGISIHYGRMMERAVKEGIPFKSLHKLRHTYATMLMDAGANPKSIQANLGHEDISITLGTYAHSYAKRQKEDVAKLDCISVG